MGGKLRTGILVAVPSDFSSKPETPVFPHMILVWSALPTPETMVSGCQWEFVCWPFKKLPVSLADFRPSLVDSIPTEFYFQMLGELLFPALVLWTGWDPSPSWGIPAAEMSSGISATNRGSRASPFCISAHPTSPSMASSQISAYKTAVPLVFGWLFKFCSIF